MNHRPFSFRAVLGGGDVARARSHAGKKADIARKESDGTALKKAQRAGAMAERKRITAILAMACPLTVDVAARLACSTNATPDEASFAIKAARKRRSDEPDSMPPELVAVHRRNAEEKSRAQHRRPHA